MKKNLNMKTTPQENKRNIDMDELAKKSLQSHQGQSKLQTQRASLKMSDARIFSNMQEQISLHFFGRRIDKQFQCITSIDEKYHKMIN